jgi:diphosphomevalonate decarboxylase
VLGSSKGQVVVWGNQANIKGSSDLYGSDFQIQFTKISRITKILCIGRQGEEQVSSCRSDLIRTSLCRRRFQAHKTRQTDCDFLKAEI